MPAYTTLPSPWQTELEKKTAAKPIIEIVYDPEDEAIPLSGKYDIVEMTPISNTRELDIEWIGRPVAFDMMLTFNDPDNFFNPTNSNSPFYNITGELYEDHASGATSIKLLDKSGVSFSAGKVLTIDDGTNSEDIYPDSFTAASGSTYYHEITYNAGLTYNYAKGTYIYPKSAELKEVLVRMRMTGCTSKVTCFLGKLLKPPECESGKSTLVVVDLKKEAFDRILTGADSDSSQKLKRIDTDGVLANSVSKSIAQEIDYIEYSSDALVQAAWASSSTEAKLDSYETGGGTDSALGDVGGTEYWLGVRFTLDEPITCTAVSTYINSKNGAPTGDMTFRIETDDADTPSGTLADTNATGTIANGSLSTAAWNKCTFSTAFTLPAGSYWIRLNIPDQANNVYWNINRNATGTGTNAYSTDHGTTWTTTKNSNIKYYRVYGYALQCFSESTIKSQGQYSMEAVAAATDSLDEYLTRTFSTALDMSGLDEITFDIYASRSGSNLKFELVDSGGTRTEYTPSVSSANTWETITWDISGVSDANKDAVSSLVITIANADSDNTFYIDNIFNPEYRAFDRTKVKVFDNCKLTEWTASFTSNTEFILKAADIGEGVNSVTDLTIYGILSGAEHPFRFNNIYDIAIYKHYAIITNGFQVDPYLTCIIIDIEDPQNPQFVTSFGGNGSPNYMNGAYKLAVENNYLYVLSWNDDYLNIYDISDISNPTRTGGIAVTVSDTPITGGMVAKDGYVYAVVCDNDWLKIFDVRDPTNPTLASTFSGNGAPNYMNGPRNVKIYGDYAYVVTEADLSVNIIDVSDKTNPTISGVLLSTDLGDPLDFFTLLDLDINEDATYLYTTTINGRFNVIDISNKTAPSQTSNIQDANPPYLSSAYSIQYRDNRCYLGAFGDNALSVIDVSDPTDPTHADILVDATYFSTGYALRLYGDYALMGSSSNYSFITVRITTSDTNLVGNENIRIPSDAWQGTRADGDTVTFATAISYEDQNIVQCLYDIYEDHAGISSQLIDRSSYLADRYVGTLFENASASATTIKVKILVPMLIKTGETLTITEGSTTEDVTVNTGVDTNSKYPPYIDLTVSALSNSYSPAATVTWKQRSSLDTDFSWDAEYHYFDLMDYNIKYSLDREMKISQGIERISRHGDCFTFTDNWGVEKIHTFRPHYNSSVPTIAKDTNLCLPTPTIQTKEMVNEIKVLYGYDYTNSKYLYELTYPESRDDNKGYIRHGFVRQRILRLAGVFDEDYAKSMAAHKWFMWQNGLTVFRFNTTLQGMVLTIGDHVDLDCDNPDIDTEIEIIGIPNISYLGKFDLSFLAYDAEFIWNNWFLIEDSGIGTGKVLW